MLPKSTRQERINLILTAATKYSFELRKTREYVHVALIFIPENRFSPFQSNI